MSGTVASSKNLQSDSESAAETLKRMIRYTKTEADRDGRTLCSYFLDMALHSLDEDSKDLDRVLKAKITPLVVKDTRRMENAHN